MHWIKKVSIPDGRSISRQACLEGRSLGYWAESSRAAGKRTRRAMNSLSGKTPHPRTPKAAIGSPSSNGCAAEEGQPHQSKPKVRRNAPESRGPQSAHGGKDQGRLGCCTFSKSAITEKLIVRKPREGRGSDRHGKTSPPAREEQRSSENIACAVRYSGAS